MCNASLTGLILEPYDGHRQRLLGRQRHQLVRSCSVRTSEPHKLKNTRTSVSFSPLTRIHSLHRRLIVRVQRQRLARHAVHAPAVLDRHKVRVVLGHQRNRVRGVGAVEAGEAPASGLVRVIGRIVFAGRDNVGRGDADSEQDDGVLAAG